MAKHPDVAIIGGGIIGLTCAYFLAREGLAVEVFDRGDLGKEASWAGAGIIPPGNPYGAATPIDKMRAIGSMRFPGFSDELRELTGIDNGYLRCGAVEFLEPDEVREVTELWQNEGIAFEKLSHAALRTYEPALAGEAAGSGGWCACGARVRPAERVLVATGPWTEQVLTEVNQPGPPSTRFAGRSYSSRHPSASSPAC